jgi:hypothetical protein
VVAAVRRIVGPAKVLAAVAGGLWRCGALAAVALTAEAHAARDGDELSRRTVLTAVVTLLVLLVPAWWLHHAQGTFRDLLALPDRLRRPDLTIDSRDDVRQLRRGGFLSAARTIRRTVGEVTDFLGPVASVVEVVAPPFWLWTAVAAVATLVLGVLAVLVGPLVLLLA